MHQPNYLPWLGYFDKIKRSDIFIILDDAQFPRGKQHFGHRNLIKTNNGTKWLTLPILNKSSMLPFNQTELNSGVNWQVEHLNLLEHFYQKAPHYRDYIYNVKYILSGSYSSISALNITMFRWLNHMFNIRTQMEVSSRIAPGVVGFDRIKTILKELGATSYISGSGPGSMRYIDEQWFSENNIKLEWQNYQHPIYRQQFGDFVPNMCALDLLFNEGPNAGMFI